MGVIVPFDYPELGDMVPQFAGVTADQADTFFERAEAIHKNDGSGPVNNARSQKFIMWNLTAHFASRFQASAVSGSGSVSQLVGRITNASEGSVSVGTENQYPPGTPQWYQQTKYGSDAWLAMSAYLTARYLPGPQRRFDPIFPGPWGWGDNWW